MTQESILARLNVKFPKTDNRELDSIPFMSALCELTNTTIHDHGLSPRCIAISANDEYFNFLKESHTSVASWDKGLPIYYEFDSTDFPMKWYFQATYWRYEAVDKAVTSFRTSYRTFIPNVCFPLVLECKGIYVIIAPMGLDTSRSYNLAKALPDTKIKMDVYDKNMQDEVKAGYKWKLEFEKHESRGIRRLFGYYTDKRRAYSMGGIVANQGAFIFIGKVETAKDSQYSEAKVFD